MKKVVGAISSLLCIMYCQSALADQIPDPSGQWRAVAKTADNVIFQIDNNIYRQGQIVGFWMQAHEPNGKRVAAYTGANCSNRAYKGFAAYTFNSAGKIVGKNYTPSNVDVAQNGSVAAMLIDVACGNTSNAQADIVKAQLEALSRDRETNARMITETMRATMEMFK